MSSLKSISNPNSYQSKKHTHMHRRLYLREESKFEQDDKSSSIFMN